jgi:two-component system, NtrC family, nitrogen regulation sensor histidine kinase NtrY
MVYKKFYYILIFRIFLIAVTSLVFFFFVFQYPNYSVLIILGTVFILQTFLLIRYITRINKKLEHFFLIYLSGEVMTSGARNKKEDEFGPMYRYFKEINLKLEKARIDNEIRNNYFKTIVDQTSVGLVSFSPDANVEFINDAAKRIFGIHVLRNLRKLDNVKDGFAEMLIKMRSNEQKLVSIILNGEMVQLATKKVMFKAGDKTLHLVSFQNIQPELDEKELESWQKLIRVLTHEIMNSMTPIITLVTTITRLYRNKETGELKKPGEILVPMVEKTVKGLDLIESRGQGLIHFVQNYRDVTRLPKPDFKILNVRDMFQGIKLMFDDQLQQNGVTLTIDCHPSLFINADGKLLEQVIINLVKNAIEAFEDAPDPTIIMSAQSNNNQIIMEIADNGKGIPNDMLENIFVPFFTTKEKGSGIGLSLSRQIIRLHGGTMNVQSEPFSRTAFTIKI